MASAEHDFVVYKRGEEFESDAWDDTVLIKAYDNAVSAMKAKLAEQHPEFSPHPINLNAETKKKKKNKAKMPKGKKNQKHRHVKWSVGDSCQAVYFADGEIYDAKILSIDDGKRTCILQYVDYGNEEEQKLSDLLPVQSAPSSQEQQTDTASEEIHTGRHRKKKSTFNHHHQPHAPKWPWGGSYSQVPPFGTVPPYVPQPFPQFQPPHTFAGFNAPGTSSSVPPCHHSPFTGFQTSGHSSSIPPMFPCVPPPPLFTERGSGDENEALYSMLISWYMSGYHTGYYQGLKQSAHNASGNRIPR
ncbi:SMN protein Smn1 [Bulinus truncatus]|nr:SMN protein Smn1 [Bulinus truncatus]